MTTDFLNAMFSFDLSFGVPSPKTLSTSSATEWREADKENDTFIIIY